MINNRYEIVEKLGEGRSKVFKCKDKFNPELIIGIKVLDSMCSNDELQAFKNEFKLLKKINHPNIISVFNFGKIFSLNDESKKYKILENSYFFTMEYFEGEELSNFNDKSESAVCKILCSISSVLFYLHSSNLVYGDLKLENILFRVEDNHVKLKFIDFGFTTYFRSGDSLISRGTLEYLAPELIEQKEADNRIDFYSLGVIIYKILFNQFPYTGSTTLEMVNAHLKHEINYPQSDYSDKLISTVKKLLERVPDKRYSNGIQILSDFQNSDKDIIDSFQLNPKALYIKKPFDEITHYINNPSEGKVIVLRGEYGQGKSTLMESITEEYLNSILISPSGSNSNNEIIESIFYPLLYSSSFYGKLDKSVRQYAEQNISADNIMTIEMVRSLSNLFIKANNNFVLLIDDLDIASAFENEILLEMIKIFQSSNVHIIIVEDINSEQISRQINNLTSLELVQFNESQVKEFIKNSLSHYYPTDKLLGWVNTEAGGNANKIIELLITLKDSSLIKYKSDSAFVQEINSSSKKTLHEAFSNINQNQYASLLQREKKILEIISVFPESVSLNTLLRITDHKKTEVIESIDHLRQKGIISSLSSSINPVISSEAFKNYLKEQIKDFESFCKNIAKIVESFASEYLQNDLAVIFNLAGQPERSYYYYSKLIEQADSRQALKLKVKLLEDSLSLNLNQKQIADLHISHAEAIYKLGEFNQSFEELSNTNLELFEKDDIANVDYLKARCLLKKGELSKSKDLLEKLISDSTFTESNPEIFSDLANIELDMNNYEKVDEIIERVFSSNVASGKTLSQMYNFKGLVQFYQFGDLEKTLDYFKESLKLAEKSNNLLLIVKMQVNIANIYDMQGNKKNAVKYWQNALRLNQTTGNLEQEAQLLLNLGIFDVNNGKYEIAISKYSDALSRFRGIDYKHGIGLCLLNLGEAEAEILNFSKAEEYLTQAIDIFMALNNEDELAEVYLLLIKNHSILNQKTKLIELKNQLNLTSKDFKKEIIIEYLSFLLDELSDGKTSNFNSCEKFIEFFRESGNSFNLIYCLEIYINSLLAKERIEETKQLLLEEQFVDLFKKNNIFNAWYKYFLGMISDKNAADSNSNSGDYFLEALKSIENEVVTRVTFMILLRLSEYFRSRGNNKRSKNYLAYALPISQMIEKSVLEPFQLKELNDDYLIKLFRMVSSKL